MNQEYCRPFFCSLFLTKTSLDCLNPPPLTSLALFKVPLNLAHPRKCLVHLLKSPIAFFIPNINHDPLLFLFEINSLLITCKTWYL